MWELESIGMGLKMVRVGEIWMLMLGGQGGQVELCPKATHYLYIYIIYITCPAVCPDPSSSIMLMHSSNFGFHPHLWLTTIMQCVKNPLIQESSLTTATLGQLAYFLDSQDSLLQYIMGITTQTMFEPQNAWWSCSEIQTYKLQAKSCLVSSNFFGGPKWWPWEETKASFWQQHILLSKLWVWRG